MLFVAYMLLALLLSAIATLLLGLVITPKSRALKCVSKNLLPV